MLPESHHHGLHARRLPGGVHAYRGEEEEKQKPHQAGEGRAAVPGHHLQDRDAVCAVEAVLADQSGLFRAGAWLLFMALPGFVWVEHFG